MMIATTPATCMAESTARIDSDAATRSHPQPPATTQPLEVLPEVSNWEVPGLAEAGRVRTWALAVW